jgi:arylsulfate sulfotransferase
MINVFAAGTPAYFIDRDAHPIWYYDVGKTNEPYMFKFLPNGHIILMISEPTSTLIRELDLAGNTIRELSATALAGEMQAAGFDFVPANYTHDLVPLANDHLIVITNFYKSFTDLPGYPGTIGVVGDGIVDLDQNWNPEWAWNSFDHLDVNRHLNGLPDWTHGNAIVYVPDGNLLLSMRHQSWVLKIDYNNGSGAGDILWKLGYQGDFALTQAGIPTDDPSLWFSFQHFPSLISQTGSQTSLTIWDNGDNRPLDANGTVCGAAPAYTPCYSRATIFQLDESTSPPTADLAWANAPGYYGTWGGSINQLANTNVEFDANSLLVPPAAGIASEVLEVTQDSTAQTVWKLDISRDRNRLPGISGSQPVSRNTLGLLILALPRISPPDAVKIQFHAS